MSLKATLLNASIAYTAAYEENLVIRDLFSWAKASGPRGATEHLCDALGVTQTANLVDNIVAACGLKDDLTQDGPVMEIFCSFWNRYISWSINCYIVDNFDHGTMGNTNQVGNDDLSNRRSLVVAYVKKSLEVLERGKKFEMTDDVPQVTFNWRLSNTFPITALIDTYLKSTGSNADEFDKEYVSKAVAALIRAIPRMLELVPRNLSRYADLIRLGSAGRERSLLTQWEVGFHRLGFEETLELRAQELAASPCIIFFLVALQMATGKQILANACFHSIERLMYHVDRLARISNDVGGLAFCTVEDVAATFKDLQHCHDANPNLNLTKLLQTYDGPFRALLYRLNKDVLLEEPNLALWHFSDYMVDCRQVLVRLGEIRENVLRINKIFREEKNILLDLKHDLAGHGSAVIVWEAAAAFLNFHQALYSKNFLTLDGEYFPMEREAKTSQV